MNTQDEELRDELTAAGLIPLDKSWMIRMGILDILSGNAQRTIDFLSKQPHLGGDLKALIRAAKVWDTDEPVDVGEAGTLLRILTFASWKFDLNKKFIIRGTLLDREIEDDPDMVNWSLERLHALKTSQWTTAAILLGNTTKLQNPRFKVQVSYDATAHWTECMGFGKHWKPRYDETILKQALHFIKLLQGRKNDFVAEQAEDFCFAYVFGLITAEEGDRLWPALRDHESNRILEMPRVIEAIKSAQHIDSNDHRVVQAGVMYSEVYGKLVTVANTACVSKSWPRFWDFIDLCREKEFRKP